MQRYTLCIEERKRLGVEGREREREIWEIPRGILGEDAKNVVMTTKDKRGQVNGETGNL